MAQVESRILFEVVGMLMDLAGNLLLRGPCSMSLQPAMWFR
jgi:hypothetical protein